jgi:ribosomal protein S20
MKNNQSLKSELVDALKRCLTHIEIGDGHKANDFECVHAARKAIAKATKKN